MEDAALLEGVSGESRVASADWDVIDHLTLGILTAGAGTRVSALHVETYLTGEAVGAGDALRATALVGISEIIRLAHTGPDSVELSAIGVDSARIRLARSRDWSNRLN